MSCQGRALVSSIVASTRALRGSLSRTCAVSLRCALACGEVADVLSVRDFPAEPTGDAGGVLAELRDGGVGVGGRRAGGGRRARHCLGRARPIGIVTTSHLRSQVHTPIRRIHRELLNDDTVTRGPARRGFGCANDEQLLAVAEIFASFSVRLSSSRSIGGVSENGFSLLRLLRAAR